MATDYTKIEWQVMMPTFRDVNYDIRNFGAIAGGFHLNTEAINKAVQICSGEGGGKVIVSSGIWLTGPITLHSNVNLHLESGATILFSSNMDEYPLIVSSFEGLKAVRCQSPIDAENLENAAITGEGTFDGAGAAWRPVKKYKMTESKWNNLVSSGGVVDEEQEIWWPTDKAMQGLQKVPQLQQSGSLILEDYQVVKDFLRPNMVSLRKCKNILIDGPTFQNSPAWCLHPWICENVTIRNLTVRNPWYSQNGDGLDVESCKNVVVDNCIFDVGDDAICIKSGKDEEGRKLGKPAQNIMIKNCTVYSGHGGFVIGSEMSGGVKEVTIKDCTFFGTDTGLRFKSKRGRGGTVENVAIDSINMIGIKKEAIVFHMFYEQGDSKVLESAPFSEQTPVFQKISISNVNCIEAETAILLRGLPEKPLEQLSFENIFIKSTFGIDCSYLNHSTFTNIKVVVNKGERVTINNCVGIRGL
ncbi:glycoside hydrolase family 28 protein [Sutcliffiella rhizosphaerae]|uniref:Glycoside hydrolase family 28 protein n=1 Tax=Sutcliffiella rhizosphaerae TaxID=2880967 RepID=A0ABM8YM29_9BACI|nr:glycoside hydrolase family 28 protein [Sutcliffiella rhizosphaerae]CAG9620960.1 hypothetical protein BACCIP111883_01732 [Sutcliffiella rhizosphaerae]